MKKIALILIIIITFVSIGFSTYAENTDNSKISIMVNDSVLNLDIQPMIVNDRTLVPLRAVFEKLGATVEYLDEYEQVKIAYKNIKLSLVVNSTQVNIDNGGNLSQAWLDVPARIENDRVLVPVRFLSESIGLIVSWDSINNTVLIVDLDDFWSRMKKAVPLSYRLLFGNDEYNSYLANGNVESSSTFIESGVTQSTQYTIDVSGRVIGNNVSSKNVLKFIEPEDSISLYPISTIEYEKIMVDDNMYIKLNPSSILGKGLEDKWVDFGDGENFPLPTYDFNNSASSVLSINNSIKELAKKSELSKDVMINLNNIYDSIALIEKKVIIVKDENGNEVSELTLDSKFMKFFITMFTPELMSALDKTDIKYIIKNTHKSDKSEETILATSMFQTKPDGSTVETETNYKINITPKDGIESIILPNESDIIAYSEIEQN